MSANTMKILLTLGAAALAIAAQQPWASGARDFLMVLAGSLVGTAHVPQPGTKAKVEKARESVAP